MLKTGNSDAFFREKRLTKNRQDMQFYNTYRTGDLMTRLTGDLEAVRFSMASSIRALAEAIFLFLYPFIFSI